MESVFVNAIRELTVVEFYYPPGMRKIEPHAIGRGSSNQLLVRAFQTEGASASGEHENWKLFRLDKAGNTDFAGEHFAGSRPGYKRGDKAMSGGIIEEL